MVYWGEGRMWVRKMPKRLLFTSIVLLTLLYASGMGDRYLLTVLTFSSVMAVYSSTLNFTAAYVGQVNLGHAIFFGSGGYVTAYLSSRLGLPLVLTIPLAALFSLTAGLLLGSLTLRTRGPFLLLITALSNIVIVNLVYTFSRFTGGEDGIGGLIKITGEPSLNYYIFTSYMIATITLLFLILRSRIGYAFRTIKEDETLAGSIGINVVKYKLLAFSISSILTGLLGALYAHYLGVAGPALISFELTFQALIMIILGGWGTLLGPVVGSYIVVFFSEYLRILGLYRTLLIGAATIIVILRFRKGVYGALGPRLKNVLSAI